MTRGEAIQWLTDIKENITENWSHDVAIDMAIEALSAEEAVWNEYEAEFTDLPDIPRYYYEKVVGKMAHEINVLREQLESAEAVQGEWKIDEYGIYHCPFCHAINNTVYKSFCPNCGARMEATNEL